MWTCGIDMATQQAKPARQSTTCSALGERPSPGPPARKSAEAAGSVGARRRNTSRNGSMLSAQNTPMPTWVARQPSLETKC